MITFLKNIFNTTPYPLQEGLYADSYTDPEAIEIIKAGYKARWMPETTPYTHPALYDPFNPPKGWRYDPFYEMWIKINE